MNVLTKLEKRFAKIHNNKYGVVVNSGYSALILALASLKIGVGDEVICPDYTMAATAFAITVRGAKPIFVDCKDDLNIDPEKIRLAITEKTKAIIVTHIYGRVCDMDSILKIAKDIPVIEDACEAHGALGVGRGVISCFSFYKNKIVCGEEGGICITNDKHLADRMRSLKSMAFNEKGRKYDHIELGYNFRMPESQAEIILKSLANIKKNLEKRRGIEKIYNALLPSKIQMPARDVVWVYDIKTSYKEELLKLIPEARDFFVPMSQLAIYKPLKQYNENANWWSKHGMYLPVNIDMEKVTNICNLINKYYEEKKYS